MYCLRCINMVNINEYSSGRYVSGIKLDKYCLNCGKHFQVNHWLQERKYCSLECNIKFKVKHGTGIKRESKPCPQCGKVFSERPSRLAKRTYCSYECSVEAKKTRVNKICPICNNGFSAPPNQINRGKGVVCSHDCWIEYRRQQSTISLNCKQCGKEITMLQSNAFNTAGDGSQKRYFCSTECAIEDKKRRVLKKCLTCGKVIEVQKSIDNRGNGLYCDVKCMAIGRSGEKACNWQGGVSFEPYCTKFNVEFRRRVRAFFEYRCVLCGKSEKDNNRRLSVHHVNHNKQTCCDDSKPLFVVLCASCHGKTHGKGVKYMPIFEEMINTKFNGKCFYTVDEYKSLPEVEL